MLQSVAPLISVVTPCYNAERFLGETLDSLLAQTFTDFEVIIIDDGSTDGSTAVVDSYRDRLGGRLIFESGPNRGVSAARNRGTGLASGKYVQYLDADDLLRPHALQAKFDALEASGDDIAYTDWQKLNESPNGTFAAGDVFALRWQEVSPEAEVAVFVDFWSPPAALLYRREIVDRVGGSNPAFAIIQDGRFLFDAVRIGGKLRHVPGVGADYRIIHGGLNWSKRDPTAFVREWAEDAFQVEAMWRSDGELTAARKSALLRRLAKTTRVLYECDRPAFWRVYKHMHELDPNYLPEKPRALRAATRVFGYPRAQALALAARRGLQWLRRSG